MPEYDVIVVGGGSAGTSAATAAAAQGARTLMVNDGELGGLCILRGCMPSKAMLASAHAAHAPTRAEPFGVRLEGRMAVDFERVMARKNAQVARFQRAKLTGIERGGYEVLDGRARFAAGGGVEVGGRRLEAHRYVIATGSTPSAPPIDGLAEIPYWTSDDVMRLERRPASLAVLGTGAIGLEMAQFFARIGTEVCVLGRSPLLWRYDADAGRELHASLASEHWLELHIPCRVLGVRPGPDGGAEIEFEDADGRATKRFEAVLVATGRDPALDGLALECAGVELDRGRIRTDTAMRTSNPEVYAAGDATGSFQLLHIANQEGRVAGVNAALGKPRERIDRRLDMSMFFTDPPYARVGLDEDRAREIGHDVVVGRSRFPETGRAITMGVEHGVWSLVADANSGEILGTSILGPRADDLAHTVSAVMYYRGTVDDIPKMPWYHPTLSEVMLDLVRQVAAARGKSGSVAASE